MTVAQAAIAWVLSRGTDIIAVIGARRRDRLAEALALWIFPLPPPTSLKLNKPCRQTPSPARADNSQGMSSLDSER